MDPSSLLILLFLFASAMQPVLQARLQAMQRTRQIAAIESERGSRVITMIHRQDTRSLFSVPVSRMIDLEDAQQIIPVIQTTPADTPIDLILHTPGGMVLAAMQIARRSTLNFLGYRLRASSSSNTRSQSPRSVT